MSYEDFLGDYVDRDEPHTVSATDAARQLLDLAVAGELWARQRVFELTRAALIKEIKERRQAASEITFTDGAGRKRRMKTAHSRPMVNRESGEVESYQLVLAWDMDAEALNALLLDLQRSSREVRERIAAVRALIDALARHPECTTAREAWTADGRSTDEIDLSA
jgi:transcription elongation GreA/GreB family factor